ncbi:MAG: hypothetical protein KGN76_04990 [Acidobacteriota bacterium]|nr:hypothetical protein [Acidobacteriota bacterium]
MHTLHRAGLPFVAGFLVPVFVERLTGWWLNSGRGVALVLLVVLVLSALVTGPGREAGWGRTTALGAGAFLGSTSVLLWIGPGTIWPIVLVVAAALLAMAAVAGGGLAYWLHGRSRVR